MMEERVREAFKANLKRYRCCRYYDEYSARQMAALSTREDFNISKNELIRILENE